MVHHRPSTLEDVMATLRSLASDKGASLQDFWNRHWRAVPARLDRMVRNKVVAKVLVKGRNYFVPGETVREVADRFDLSDPTARLVAADYLEERGQEQLAGRRSGGLLETGCESGEASDFPEGPGRRPAAGAVRRGHPAAAALRGR